MSNQLFRKQLSTIMRYAWKLYRESIKNFSVALKLAWRIITSRCYRRHSRAYGCSYHQDNLKKLSKLHKDQYIIKAIPEPDNKHDRFAIVVVADVLTNNRSVSRLKLGYMSKQIAKSCNEAVGDETVVVILLSELTGVKSSNKHIGLNMTYITLSRYTHTQEIMLIANSGLLIGL